MELRFPTEFCILKRLKSSVSGAVVFVGNVGTHGYVETVTSEALEHIWTGTNCLDI
jgi:hypothetical protein